MSKRTSIRYAGTIHLLEQFREELVLLEGRKFKKVAKINTFVNRSRRGE